MFQTLSDPLDCTGARVATGFIARPVLFHLVQPGGTRASDLPHCDAAVVRFARSPAADGNLHAGGTAPEKRDATVSPKATLLIVDDEPDVREVLEEYFAAHGYATIAAENARRREGIGGRARRSTWRWSTSTCRARMA